MAHVDPWSAFRGMVNPSSVHLTCGIVELEFINDGVQLVEWYLAVFDTNPKDMVCLMERGWSIKYMRAYGTQDKTI